MDTYARPRRFHSPTYAPAMTDRIAVVGVPTALGGELPDLRHVGMASAPADLRRLGLLSSLHDRGLEIRDDGDLPIEPGWKADPDPRAKNRAEIAAFLPREAEMVAASVAHGERLLILGGDCCAHAGAMAGLRRADPGRRLAPTHVPARRAAAHPTRPTPPDT